MKPGKTGVANPDKACLVYDEDGAEYWGCLFFPADPPVLTHVSEMRRDVARDICAHSGRKGPVANKADGTLHARDVALMGAVVAGITAAVFAAASGGAYVVIWLHDEFSVAKT